METLILTGWGWSDYACAAALTLRHFGKADIRGVSTRRLPELLNACSLVGLLGGFTIGHFDLPTAVYYLSLAVLFVFLTVQLQIKPERKGGDPR